MSEVTQLVIGAWCGSTAVSLFLLATSVRRIAMSLEERNRQAARYYDQQKRDEAIWAKRGRW